MKQSETIQLKKDSHSCYDDARKRARKDKIKVAKFKSPDVNKKKYSYFDPVKKAWIYADSEKVFNHMKKGIVEPVVFYDRVESKEDVIDRMVKMYETNTIPQISQHFGYSVGAVYNKLIKAGVEMRTAGTKP